MEYISDMLSQRVLRAVTLEGFNSTSGAQNNRPTLDSLSHVEDYVRRSFKRKQITVALFLIFRRRMIVLGVFPY